MTDPFATLGVERRFTLDSRLLEQRHRDLSRAVHPDRYVHAPPAEKRAALEHAVAVNDAYRALRDPMSRAAALLALAGRPLTEEGRAEPQLLLEVMELREALDAARGHAARVEVLRAEVEKRVAAEESLVAGAFDGGAQPTGEALERAYQALIRMRYFRRFLESAAALDEGDF